MLLVFSPYPYRALSSMPPALLSLLEQLQAPICIEERNRSITFPVSGCAITAASLTPEQKPSDAIDPY